MLLPSHIHFCREEALVKRGIVGDADVVAEEGPQSRHDALWTGLAPDHCVRDASETRYERWDPKAWIHQFREGGDDNTILHDDRGHLNDAVRPGTQPSRFEVDDGYLPHELLAEELPESSSAILRMPIHHQALSA